MKSKHVKHDQGKLRWDLLPIKPIEQIIKVLMLGADKYSDNNWMNCTDNNRYWNAAMRHLTEWKREKNDKESGLSHLGHACCCLLFLMFLEDKDAK